MKIFTALFCAVWLSSVTASADILRIDWPDLIPDGAAPPSEQRIGAIPSPPSSRIALADELSGKDVQLSGYLLPADREGDLVHAFMLVPSRGACSHMQQPPPSQVVHVFPEEPYRLSVNYEPVTVSGVISPVVEKTQLFILDGVAVIVSGYRIRKARVNKSELPVAPAVPWSFIERHRSEQDGQAAVPAGSLSSTR